jgi:uncharacterized protein YxeA
MKKILSIILAVAMLACMALTLVSCSEKIEKGTYKAADGATIEVSSSKITMKKDNYPDTVYKYEINEDDAGNLTITLDPDYKTDNEAYESFVESQTLSYSSSEGKIVIGGKEYKKQ